MPSKEQIAAASHCWLCERPLGRRHEWHHRVPKSKGGKELVPLHPICHRTIHATLSNSELAGPYAQKGDLAAHAEIAKFIRWIAKKPPDFHAPTRRRK